MQMTRLDELVHRLTIEIVRRFHHNKKKRMAERNSEKTKRGEKKEIGKKWEKWKMIGYV